MIEKRFGRYTIVGDLGSGGMGRVCRARDTVLGRDVALKLLHEDGDAANDESMRVLLQEARAAAAIDHPNAVAIFDVGEIDRQPFLAMELISGKTLRQHISEDETPLAVRVAWLIDVAHALAAAHRGHVLHRDIKPENVIVREDDGVVKVVDFGIARPLASIDRAAATQSMRLDQVMSGGSASSPILTGGIRGTPSYMAPEQLRGELLDGRADQFAWGILAYELLCGVHPWPSHDALGTVRGIASDPAPSLRAREPGVREGLERIVHRALAKKREARFATMDDLAIALRSEAVANDDASTNEAYFSVGGVLFAIVAVCIIAAAVLTPNAPLPPRPHVAASPPPPPSANADAMASYREGVQLVRDGSRSAAVAAFDKAATIDPTFAAAHLRAAMFVDEPDSAMRTHLQLAAQFRNSLSFYERMLLRVFQPLASSPADWNESVRRIEQLTATYDRSEVWISLGDARLHAAQNAEALAAFYRALAIDPSAALALHGIGRAYLVENRLDDARGTFERCLAISPASLTCLGALILFLRSEGRCEEEAVHARRYIALTHGNLFGYQALANAVYGSQNSVARARDVFRDGLEQVSPEKRPIAELASKTRFSVLSGDFPEADRTAALWQSAVSSRTDEREHISPSWYRMTIALEMGRKAEAAALARTYLSTRAGWLPNDFASNPSIYAIDVLHRAGAIDDHELERLRIGWLADEQTRERKTGDDHPLFAWMLGYAHTATTHDEAIEAIRQLPKYGKLTSSVNGGIDFEASLGEVYRLAGDAAEATIHLRAASYGCSALDYPFQHVWSWLRLAQQQEAMGDQPNACRAYRAVLTKWNSAPQSKTVIEAKNAVRRLRCN